MSGPGPHSGEVDPVAESPARRDPAGESGRRAPTADQGAGRDAHAEAQLGGADAIEKTTYVVGEGAEPEARPTGSSVARDSAGAGSIAVWLVGGLAALIALVYALGIFA
jgi:hypothetical protein